MPAIFVLTRGSWSKSSRTRSSNPLRVPALPVALRGERADEAVQVAPAIGAFDRVLRGREVETVAEGGFVDDVGELVRGQDIGEIDECAGHGGDGDAVVFGDVAGVYVAGAVQLEPALRSALFEREHV